MRKETAASEVVFLENNVDLETPLDWDLQGQRNVGPLLCKRSADICPGLNALCFDSREDTEGPQ